MAGPLNIGSILSGAGCLIVGAGIGYLLAGFRQQVSSASSPDDELPATDSQSAGEFVRLPEMLRELSVTVGTNPTIQSRFSEIIRLVEKQAAGIERIVRDSRTDALTGLWNRRALDEQVPLLLSEAQRYGTPLSVVMVDVDRFKQVNDEYGHPAGDAALQHIARLLRTGLRDADFIARYGGEEFVILLTQTDLARALIAVERIRKSIQESPFHVAEKTVVIEVSMGLAQVRPNDRFSDVLARADAALLQAKGAGRNQIGMEGAP